MVHKVCSIEIYFSEKTHTSYTEHKQDQKEHLVLWVVLLMGKMELSELKAQVIEDNTLQM